ncbi:D(2) dopamine receptor-like [Cetorhinus maximus]
MIKNISLCRSETLRYVVAAGKEERKETRKESLYGAEATEEAGVQRSLPVAAPNTAALNDSQMRELGPWSNSAGEQWRHRYNFYAALLSLLIFVVVFGHVLMCMAVSRERALQTTTNYLIVSLAVADLLVATLVMPWVVYLEVKPYTAVAMPMLYNIQAESHVDNNHGQVAVLRHLMHAALRAKKPPCYNFPSDSMTAFAIMETRNVLCPLPDKREETICAIMNPFFILYSSIVSFYVPFIVMLLVYVQICAMLRQRRKRVAAKRFSVAMDHETKPPIKVGRFQNKCTHSEDVKLCTLMVQSNGSTIVSKKKLAPSSIDASRDPECDGQARFFRRTAFEVRRVSDEKQVPVAKSAAKENCPTRRRRKQQMLAVVLGVFIICWLPFFITHILNVHCQTCYIPPALYSACAWLGYVINPIIYTTFNVEFRKAIMKILHC